MRYLYDAKLVPIGQPVNIPDEHGRPGFYTFDEKSFEIERTRPGNVNVCLKHDRSKRIGKLASLIPHKGWWIADFMLDPALHSELKVGQPVSVGLDIITIGSGVPILSEVSIVSKGAVEGACITRRHELKRSTPREPSTPRAKPSARKPTAAVPAGTVFYGASPYGGSAVVTRRDYKAAAETEELRRRIEWAEQHTGRADFEEILTHLKIELGYESRLHFRR